MSSTATKGVHSLHNKDHNITILTPELTSLIGPSSGGGTKTDPFFTIMYQNRISSPLGIDFKNIQLSHGRRESNL